MSESRYDSTFKNPTLQLDRVLVGFLLVMAVVVVITAGLTTVEKNSAAAAAASRTTTTSVSPVISKVIMQTGASSTTTLGFYPSTITVVLGKNNTVTWTNEDFAVHTVTSNTAIWDSGNIDPSTNFTYTFTAVGTYHYHCSYHPWMTGTVIVVQS